jgi:hypothetical protein
MKSISSGNVVTTAKLQKLLGLHITSISKHYGAACIGRRKVRSYASNLYSLDKVAQLISEHSGVPVERAELFELMTIREAVAYSSERYRELETVSAYAVHRRKGTGPKALKLSRKIRYVRSDIDAWCMELLRQRKAKADRLVEYAARYGQAIRVPQRITEPS